MASHGRCDGEVRGVKGVLGTVNECSLRDQRLLCDNSFRLLDIRS
jgi:hypothetical protein